MGKHIQILIANLTIVLQQLNGYALISVIIIAELRT